MRDTLETPCYVISSNGFKDSISYEDDWCYGKSRYVGATGEGRDAAREIIKRDIRERFEERNGLPLYYVSDHGNIMRIRRVSLRRR